MARPAVLQYLKHGKALCGKVFAGFVETYNHLVDVTENIKGDADLPGAKKGIKVDRTNPAAPIIRLVGDFGGVTSGNDSSGNPECFDIDSGWKLVNTYFRIGTRVEHLYFTEELSGGVWCIKIKTSYDPDETEETPPEIVRFEDIGGLIEAQAEESYAFIPLYEIGEEDGVKSVKLDMRSIPTAPMWEN